MGLKPRSSPGWHLKIIRLFRTRNAGSFRDWVINQVKYPSEAKAKKIEGWVSVNFTVELDGTISNVVSTQFR